MHSPRSKSQTGDVSLSGENVGIVDTFIDGACSFTAQLIIINGLDITGDVHFSGPVHVEPGAALVINGQTWIPKAPASPPTPD